MFLFVSLGLTAFTVTVLIDPNTLPIRHVAVSGNLQHVSPDEVRNIVRDNIAAGFLGVDVDEINAAIVKLPWIRDVSVRRVWPDTLKVIPVEQTALARWDDGGLVNMHGERFMARPDSYPDGLPLFHGPDNSESYITGVYISANRILSGEGQKIAEVILDTRRAVRLKLENEIELIMGRTNNYELLRKFCRIYNRLFSGKSDDMDRVDLRYTNGFAVHWKVGHFPHNKIQGG
jgi:cell division protein FtsQ